MSNECLILTNKTMKGNYKLFMKTLFFVFAMICVAQPAKAQSFEGEYGFFDHLCAGVSVGTDGIGIDVATPITDWAALRGGISFMPKIKYTKSINLKDEDPALNDEANIEAKLNIFDIKLLADFYPFKTSSFHITAGFFVGNDKAVTATSNDVIRNPADYGNVGIKLGGKRVTTDKDGQLTVDMKVNSFKPYIGLGFGRAIPKKNRVSVSCDFGVKFWGKPGLGVSTVKDDWGGYYYHKFQYDELGSNDNKDVKDAMEIVDKIKVYPVLNIRVCGRIF